MRIDDALALAQQIEIKRRLESYESEDATKQRNQLVEEWRKHHPDAAKETSSWLRPLIPVAGYTQRAPSEPQEYWHNDIYTVAVRRHKKDSVFGSDGGMIQLGISSLDGTARHDWRDFQAIKNQLSGPECEAFELYPADSRLLDPSNYYTLWCFPGVRRLKVGNEERVVRDADVALAPQRGLAKQEKPADDSLMPRELQEFLHQCPEEVAKRLDLWLAYTMPMNIIEQLADEVESGRNKG